METPPTVRLARPGLFIQLRGIGILGSSHAGSCITPPRYPRNLPPSGAPHGPVPLELVTPMDRYARWWMLPLETNVCGRAMIRNAKPQTCVSPGATGRGYGLEQLAMRLVRESSWGDGCLFRRSQTEDSRSL